jgi:hypothetical protein
MNARPRQSWLTVANQYGDMGYEEFTGRVLRRYRGEDERGPRPWE